jgi:hypothetical protein
LLFGVNDCYRNFEAQKKQNACQQKCFFAALGLCAQSGQNHGLQYFALLRPLRALLLQNLLCSCLRSWPACSDRFRPKLLC